MRWFEEFEEKLAQRYQKLYGEKAYREKVEKEKKLLLIKGAAIALLLCAAIAGSLLSDAEAYKNITLGKNGEIAKVTRPGAEQGSISFNARAKIATKQGTIEKEFFITIEPVGEKEQSSQDTVFQKKSEKEAAEEELRQMISKLNVDTEQQQVILPRKLQSGEKIIWSKTEESDLSLYLAGAMMLLWMLYKSRFHTVELEERKARESIIRELPEFINKIILLMNAGIVLNTAFLKILDDYNSKAEASYFYSRMGQISRSVKETNASLHLEFREFSRQSGVKELIRTANIITDNISKGADLSDKLRQENELLWFARKQQAEEKGRLAETKLTMPLMILLLVLIMVTIAPALMEM